ncbi:MAG: hypothetical protein ABI867_06265 [Kofleriaceae bacterium]
MFGFRLGCLWLATIVAIGCGDDPARVHLTPVNPGACGRPLTANQLAITGFTEHGEAKRAVGLDQAIAIDDFPADTVQFAVEVLIGGGEIGAAGKTLPLVFDDLEDGTAIPILMTPPGGFCPVGALTEARRSPLVARAGRGVLVAGGIGALGPLTTAEFYDPATATFQPVELPEAFRDPVEGIAGAVLATLADGRVVLTGGPRGLLAIFDPATLTFGTPLPITPQRAFHGAVATASGLLVSGGCQGVATGICNATPLRSTVELALDGTTLALRATLDLDAVAEGAQLFDLGDAYLLAGGFGTPGEGHRFTLEDRDAIKLTGLAAQPVLLDGGAVLTAFAADPSPPAATVAVVTPAGGVVAARDAAALAGARLVGLEDGSVVGFGGDTGSDGANGAARVIDYDPTFDRWTLRRPTPSPVTGMPAGTPGDQPPRLDAASAIRLLDGSVLVLGGEAAASANAWIYRPSLVGASSGSITVTPASPTNLAVLTAPDPTRVTLPDFSAPMPAWLLTSVDDSLAARALVGGPRMRRGSVKATVDVRAGGVALIAQQTSPTRALVAQLISGQTVRLDAPVIGTVCVGDVIEIPPGNVTITLAVADAGVTVSLGDTVVLACDHVASDTGAWGVAASGTGAQIAVATVTVAR